MKKSVIPLEVPWQISSSTTYMELYVNEFDGTKLTFVGNLIVDVSDYPDTEFVLEVRYDDLNITDCYSEGKPKIVGAEIEVTLDSGWIRSHSMRAAKTLIQEFDFGRIKREYRPFVPIQNIDEYRPLQAKMYCQWLRTKICPMPLAFEVIDSKWVTEVQELGLRIFDDVDDVRHYAANTKDLTHYIFCGNDMYIEALTTKLSWRAKVEEFKDEE